MGEKEKQEKTPETDPSIKYQLDEYPTQYLDLWKRFSEEGNEIKDKMWAMATFFFTLLGGLLGFAGNKLSSEGAAFIQVEEPAMVFVVGVVGCLLSYYGWYMVGEYGKHIRNAWNRADYIRREKIEGLSEVWCWGISEKLKADKAQGEDPNEREKLPKSAVRLRQLMLFYLVGFSILAIVGFLAMVIPPLCEYISN